MLNNFCFHVYAQKSLGIGENDNEVFFDSLDPVTFRVHRAGSQLKIRLEEGFTNRNVVKIKLSRPGCLKLHMEKHPCLSTFW